MVNAHATTAAKATATRCRRMNLRARYAAPGRTGLDRFVARDDAGGLPAGRWPSRSGARGPSPAPSSRSSPGRHAQACQRGRARSGGCLATSVELFAERAEPRRRLGRLGFADHPADFVQAGPAQRLGIKRRRCPSAVRRAARPASRCRCACPRPPRSTPPAPGSCRPGCRSSAGRT